MHRPLLRLGQVAHIHGAVFHVGHGAAVLLELACARAHVDVQSLSQRVLRCHIIVQTVKTDFLWHLGIETKNRRGEGVFVAHRACHAYQFPLAIRIALQVQQAVLVQALYPQRRVLRIELRVFAQIQLIVQITRLFIVLGSAKVGIVAFLQGGIAAEAGIVLPISVVFLLRGQVAEQEDAPPRYQHTALLLEVLQPIAMVQLIERAPPQRMLRIALQGIAHDSTDGAAVELGV